MNRTEPPVEALRGYLRQLAPQTRARLLAEVERLRQSGEDFPGVEIIVAELSSEPRRLPGPGRSSLSARNQPRECAVG